MIIFFDLLICRSINKSNAQLHNSFINFIKQSFFSRKFIKEMAALPKAKNYILFTDTFAINDMDKEGKKFDRGMLLPNSC